MSLAIFDLDNTLLSGDSDYAWGQYLGEIGAVDGPSHEHENRRYYEQYQAGTLDIYEFLAFALRPLTQYPRPQLEIWRRQFIDIKIIPMITQAARALVQHHRQSGDTLLIITATNGFITRPIATEFGIENLLATEPEEINGHFTGKVAGVPCFQEGKVTRLNTWLKEHGDSLENSWFYSDSHNDLPLLKRVTHPVAINPDALLKQQAQTAGWPIMMLVQ